MVPLMRKLSRTSKDVVIMRQFGRCGYCTDVMTDAAQTDHMDENCTNDAWDNLIACCCNCHGDKTQHYRKKRNKPLQDMLETGRTNKARWAREWADPDDDHFAKLPHWLRLRVTEHKVIMYAARRRAETENEPVDWERFRYK